MEYCHHNLKIFSETINIFIIKINLDQDYILMIKYIFLLFVKNLFVKNIHLKCVQQFQSYPHLAVILIVIIIKRIIYYFFQK